MLADLFSLLADVFPGVDYEPVDLDALKAQIQRPQLDAYPTCTEIAGSQKLKLKLKLCLLVCSLLLYCLNAPTLTPTCDAIILEL